MRNMKRNLLTGLVAGTLLVAGCAGQVGPQGPQGPQGPAGNGGAGDPSLKTVDVAVQMDAYFDAKDPESGWSCQAHKVDDLNADVGITQSAFTVDSTGRALIKALVGTNKVTCSKAGNTLMTYVVAGSGASATSQVTTSGVNTVSPITTALYTELLKKTHVNAYISMSKWTQSMLSALETAASADSDLKDAWDNGDLPANGPYLVNKFLANHSGLLAAFAAPPVCIASVSPSAVFDVKGSTLADATDLQAGISGYTGQFTVSNSSTAGSRNPYNCSLRTMFGATPTTRILTTINGVVNNSVSAANTDNTALMISCKAFDSGDGDTLSGVVGESVNSALLAADNQDMRWSAIQLSYGSDNGNASYAAAQALYLDGALLCLDASSKDCKLGTNSSIVFDYTGLGMATADNVIVVDARKDYGDDTFAASDIDENVNAFALTDAADRSSITNGSSKVQVFKNCVPSHDVGFAFNSSTDAVTFSVQHSVLVTAEGEKEQIGHFGFVVAELDPTSASFNVFADLVAQNIANDPIASAQATRLGISNTFSSSDLTLLEVAQMLVYGNGLCDPRLTAFDPTKPDRNYTVGASQSAYPNVVFAGMAPGESISMKVDGVDVSPNDGAKLIGAETGVNSFRVPVTSGKKTTITVTSNGNTQTCTVP